MTISTTTYISLHGTAPRATRDGSYITLALHQEGALTGAVYITGGTAQMRAIRDAIDAALSPSREPSATSPGVAREPADLPHGSAGTNSSDGA